MSHRERLVAELHALSTLVSSGAYPSERRIRIRARIAAILEELYPTNQEVDAQGQPFDFS